MVDEESQNDHDQQHRPRLRRHSSAPNPDRPTLVQKSIRSTLKSMASLANLLPTGTLLVFYLLSPIFIHNGKCDDANRYMTAGLVIICGLSCFLSCFTDSFRDDKGEVHYGIATRNGLWVIDGPCTIPPEQAQEYQLKVIDFSYALMSTVVFAVIALYDQNVANCFDPKPSEDTATFHQEIQLIVILFIIFPSTRHGIGYPL